MITEANRLNFIKEYYFSRKLAEIADMRSEGHDVLNLGIGNPDQPPSSPTIKRLVETASREDMHGYQSYKGLPELRQAIAGFYQSTYDVTMDAHSEVLPLIGSKEGLNHICQAFINPGDLALVPNPGYPTYTSAVLLAGGQPISYALNPRQNWEPDWEQLKPSLLQKIKVWFINYPNMPTGSAGNREMLDRFVELAKRYDILLINDNPYSMILNRNKPLSVHQSSSSRDIALELNSLSKSHNMAGWRIGMLTGRKEYLESVLKVKSNIDSGMFRPLQEAAIVALNNSEAWHEARNDVYAHRRELAGHILGALGCTWSEEQVGMFVWARIDKGYKSAEALSEKVLQQCHVFITPGFIFGDQGKRYVRISLCSKEPILREALERIQSIMI